MMNSKKIKIFVFTFSALTLILFLFIKNSSNPLVVKKSLLNISPDKSFLKRKKKKIKTKAHISINANDIEDSKSLTKTEKSIIYLAERFKDLKNPNSTKTDLIEILKKYNLEPEISIDQTDGIPNLSIIRTAKTFNGLKYIHAQYEGNSPEDEKLQHFSFEIDPSPNAFENSVRLVQQALPDLGTLVPDTDEKFKIYKYGNYVVWIAERDWSELKNDPFNAYTKKDIGTVRIAIQFDIHQHMHN